MLNYFSYANLASKNISLVKFDSIFFIDQVKNIEKYIDENLGGKINGRIQDKTKHSPQIEFETKLKFLITKLHTEKAKEVCKERIEFYKSFLDRLKREINGEL